jgi:putative ABC transport system permease protein
VGNLINDLRYAFRSLLNVPGFSLIAIATLALGVGANTAVFTVVNAVLLRTLPYRDVNTIVVMKGNQSRVDVEDIQQRTQTLAEGGAVTIQPMDFTGSTEPVRIQAGFVNAELFQVLGAKPIAGRVISAQEDKIGGPLVAVVSHAFWQQRFGADPGLVGKMIPLSGKTYQVIGILPPGFTVPGDLNPELYVSLRVAYPEAAKYRGVHFMRTYWRLRPGVNLAQAQAEMRAIDQQLEKVYPAEDKGRGTQLIPLQQWVTRNTRTALLVLFGAVGFVLLVACANFANLLLARAVVRRSEIKVRLALGAGQRRLVLQILSESMLLALFGGLAGLVLAKYGVNLLLALKPTNLSQVTTMPMDWRVFLFGLGASIITGLVFGLFPAWSAVREHGLEALNEAGRGTSSGSGSHRLRRILVISEIALAMLLLAGAGLLIKGFWRLRLVDPGFDPENISTISIQLPETRYSQIPTQTAFRERVLDGLNALPGVQASMVSEVPMNSGLVTHSFAIEGRPAVAKGDEPEVDTRSVMGDYFRQMHIPLLAGRQLEASDRDGAPLAGVVNEAMVKRYFEHSSPIGARIHWAREEGPPKWITIVGVVGDVKQFGLDQEEDPAVYTPFAQETEPWRRWMVLVIRSQQGSSAVMKAAKNVIWSVDSQIPVGEFSTMTELMSTSLAERRFNMLLLGVFAGLALVLAGVGIFGLISYSVTRRTHEIGIRMALGAERADVLRLVLGEGLWVVAIGLTMGVAAACVLTRVMASMLFGVRPIDVTTFGAVAAVLGGVALAASYVPSRRATKVDPMVALHYE